jgi:hypothetical protein
MSVVFGQDDGSHPWHDSRLPTGMPVVCLLMVLALCTLPHAAMAQAWADAYQSGDYQKAAVLLQPLASDMGSRDPAPARHLAMLYAQGLGVARDPIAACSLAQASEAAAHMADASDIVAYEASLEESDQFVREHCDYLPEQDRLSATLSMGCFAFGMPEATLAVGRQTVLLGHGGIRLADTPPENLLGCPQVVARVRPLTIAPPSDAAPGVRARHFVELLAWRVGENPLDSSRRYTLVWQMYEPRQGRIGIAAEEELYSIATWPQAGLPPEFDARFRVEMIRSGHVHWRIEGAPPRRGWIMLPDEESR